MYKFLVVGCGGSGGATLAYMMDQLKSELAPLGIDALPAGWQFVHIDVPNAPDTREGGVDAVSAAGGTYISTAPSTGTYSVLDNALSTRITAGDALDEFGTWAPRKPDSVNVPIANGAGQMRAVGRAITLNRTDVVLAGLQRAWQNLNRVETNAAMADLSERMPGAGDFAAASRTIVLVVSSMAGGAGASMALDVCRLLGALPGIDPGLIAVFMVAPDAFDAIPDSLRGGVKPNALAMLGEIVAAQTVAAEPHDRAVLGAVGLQLPAKGSPPFARVFPIGSRSGIEKTLFGDGSQSAVYRGLGRGLAALMSSGGASTDFVAFDLGNAADMTLADTSFLGWGTNAMRIPWGAFGFASLSMGRDRYRHYVAQRLARSAVDHLDAGHLQKGSTATSVEQLAALLDSQWTSIAEAIGLPDGRTLLSANAVGAWFSSVAHPRQEASATGGSIIDEHVAPFVPQATATAATWLPVLTSFMSQRRAPTSTATDEAAYRWGFAWSEALEARIVEQVSHAVELFGLPYARALVQRLDSLVSDQLLDPLRQLAGFGGDSGRLPESFAAELGSMTKIVNGAGLIERLVARLREQATDLLYGRSAAIALGVLQALGSEVLAPLTRSIDAAIGLLTVAKSDTRAIAGLASVATDQYAAWPSDEDRAVPERFDVADNEVLLTPASTFAAQYELDVRRAEQAQGAQTLPEASAAAVRKIVSGLWPVAAGLRAPGGMLERRSRWRTALFNRDPQTRAPLTPSQPSWTLHLSPADLRARAMAYVSRAGEPFEEYCSLSLQDFARGTDIEHDPAALPERRRSLVAKFDEALTRALPLISVDSDAVTAIHGVSAVYRYKFSTVPFADSTDLLSALRALIANKANLAGEVGSWFDKQVRADARVTKIDIFGSYRNYSPLVFDALLTPANRQWQQLPPQGRTAFWEYRRSRTLPASLPMSDVERKAMVTGWQIGRITGRLRLPAAPYDAAVAVWDDLNGRWVPFPHPLLTPPSAFIGRNVDWLPAVLESVLLAYASALDAPVLSSLTPYRLLRSLSDANPQEPASGMTERSGLRILTQWLRSGETVSGLPSVIAGDTLDERADNAAAWMRQLRDYTAAHHLAPHNPTGVEGASRTVRRVDAAVLPIFRDLAPDMIVATDDVTALIAEARIARAEHGQSSAYVFDPFDAPAGGGA